MIKMFPFTLYTLFPVQFVYRRQIYPQITFYFYLSFNYLMKKNEKKKTMEK